MTCLSLITRFAHNAEFLVHSCRNDHGLASRRITIEPIQQSANSQVNQATCQSVSQSANHQPSRRSTSNEPPDQQVRNISRLCVFSVVRCCVMVFCASCLVLCFVLFICVTFCWVSVRVCGCVIAWSYWCIVWLCVLCVLVYVFVWMRVFVGVC